MPAEESAEEFTKAKKFSFRLLKVRGRSEAEIKERLRQKEFPDSVIAQTLQYLHQMRLVDDRQFAKDWVSARGEKSFGLRRIASELKQKGIADEIINEELEQLRNSHHEEETAFTLAKQQQLKRCKNMEKERAMQRIFQYLAHRGFNPEIIEDTLRKL
ncbi:MAG TPA: regulatory protein RecX [Candidatus Omnitrophota bacterium]|nr:regulatory protein RecX [Candidatus Omnitrophota bacterium]HPD85302.1 regulatory protein RecX [Candidatus Omnitrophota bacterium]HRZ04197.1 regulatory protein RecX [Candidatus Omnitrophota bacterium]